MKRLFFALFALSFLAFKAQASVPDMDMLPEVQKSGEVQYITGGVGDEERKAMESIRKNYNLRVMSSEIGGAYVADSKYVIKDSKGAVIVDAMAGPMFYANLPAGSYVLDATNEGRSKTQKFAVGASKPASFHFTWKP